jgi:hypothetical protein
MPTTAEDEASYIFAPIDSDDVLPDNEPSPPRIVRFVAPLLFVVIHMCITFKPNRTFFLALAFIFYLAFLVDRLFYKLDTLVTSVADVSTSRVSISQRVRERLQAYKTSHGKAIVRRDAAIARGTKALDDYLGLQDRASTLQTELTNSMAKRSEEYRQCRRDTNRGRLVCYKMLANWQAHIIDELEKLVRKFKNVAMPKVKGVKPSKGNSNGLTGPLKRIVSGLMKAQMITKGQIGITEKIEEMLAVEKKDVAEMLERVGKAEEILESVKDRALVGGGATVDENGDGMVGWEERLEVQMRRLNKYHQGMLAENREEKDEAEESGEHCAVGFAGVGVEADKA